MSYTAYTWQNGAGGGTPVTAVRLNAIEQGLVDASTSAASTDVRVRELGYNIKHPDYSSGTHKGLFLNAMAAATADGPGRPVVVPAGVWDVGTGLSLSGQTCTLKGEGGSMTGSLGAAVGSGVTIKASTQAGPVLDFLGYVWPNDHRGRLTFGGFTVQGSGSADATKANIGIRVGDSDNANSAGGVTFRDIVISKTGGACLKLQRVYLCDFENIICDTPVSAKANDVPYVHGRNVNATTFSRLGIRSILTAADCGVSGAVIIEDDGTYPSYDTILDACWFEFLHIPTNGCLIKLKSNTCILRDPSFSDIYPEASATNTAMIRIENGAVDNFGGNMVRGLIPGNDPTAPADYPTYGIVVSQPRNSIVGVKGYRGANVRLLSGSDNTYAVLGGAQSTSSDPAFINDSSVNNHVLIDDHLGVEQRKSHLLRDKSDILGRGFQVEDVATPANGAIWLGNAGSRVQGVGAVTYLSGDAIMLQRPDGTNSYMQVFMGGSFSGPSFEAGTGSPEGVHPGNKGSLYLRTDGGSGTTLYVKESGTGNTGWIAK